MLAENCSKELHNQSMCHALGDFWLNIEVL